jgi:hypothetical protein
MTLWVIYPRHGRAPLHPRQPQARHALRRRVTTDLPKRIYEHREGLVPGFTRRYGVKRLVFVETYDDVSEQSSGNGA